MDLQSAVDSYRCCQLDFRIPPGELLGAWAMDAVAEYAARRQASRVPMEPGSIRLDDYLRLGNRLLNQCYAVSDELATQAPVIASAVLLQGGRRLPLISALGPRQYRANQIVAPLPAGVFWLGSTSDLRVETSVRYSREVSLRLLFRWEGRPGEPFPA